MNNQALFSLKDKSKNLCHLLHFLFGALRVKYDLSPSEIGGKNDNNCQKTTKYDLWESDFKGMFNVDNAGQVT